jgi:predicted transcriptional regulator
MGEARARNSDFATSHAAADAVKGARASDLEARVLELLRVLGPSTIKEVAAASGLPYESISPRFKPLREKKMIEDSGERRRNVGGRMAIVWKLYEAEPKQLELF